jgi:hypothetical protein
MMYRWYNVSIVEKFNTYYFRVSLVLVSQASPQIAELCIRYTSANYLPVMASIANRYN